MNLGNDDKPQYMSFADVKSKLDKEVVVSNMPGYTSGNLFGQNKSYNQGYADNVKSGLKMAIDGMYKNGNIDADTRNQLLKAYGI